MNPVAWKLLFVSLSLYLLQIRGDKVDKSPSKLLKAKFDGTHTLDAFEVEHQDNGSISSLGITVPPEFANDTVQYDHHIYYNSTFYSDPEVAKQFWNNIDSHPKTVIQVMLSNSHRQATTVNLTFEFPFYGSSLKNVTIATGGFLYMGDYLHNWIAATQYVAPLMANFDTSQSKDSLIKYADNGTAFVVEWDKLYIKNRLTDGSFTFQVTLFKNGDITFVYKDVPYPVSNISDSSHPVKIGISDAYVLERSLLFIRRKTIYEYHRIDFLKQNIGSNTALHFTALQTCLGYKDCSSCLSADPKMECIWCEAVKRCSDGVDRLRQSWISNSCSVQIERRCPQIITNTTDNSQGETSPTSETWTNPLDKSFSSVTDSLKHRTQEAHYIEDVTSVSMGAIVTIAIFVAVLLGAAGWVFYAYKFPQTPSGQFLIKYRPSQWSLRKESGNVTTSSRHL